MDPLIGKTLGDKYQIQAEIGRGGMAVVYRAYQRSLNRYVAVKVLPAQLAFDITFVQRFLQEARAAARLRHPNIVTIHDVGEEGGIYYIVMQELPGETLAALIRREGRLSLSRTAGIIAQLAAALDHAHVQGIVHRDIKPANVIVGAGDHATLTDFGIAKAAEGTGLTRSGATVGTPEYMSPEQAQGNPVGPATDIYSLGLVAYQMLAGRVPFSGGSTPAILYQHVHENPQPVRVHTPSLPVGVDGVLAQALAKEPRQRFASAGQLATALQDAARAQPARIAGRPRKAPPLPPRADRPGSSRLPWLMGGLLLVALSSLVVAVLATRHAADPPSEATLSAAITLRPEPSPSVKLPSTPRPGRPQLIARQVVNVYQGPGNDRGLAGQTSAGQVMEAIAANPQRSWWRACCVGGNAIWVEAALVEAQGPTEDLPVIVEDSPLPAETLDLADTAIPVPVSTPTSTTIDTVAPVASATPPLSAPAVVVQQTINLRSGPGTSFAQVGQARDGDTLPIVGRNPDSSWWQVQRPGGERAWIVARLVQTRGDVGAVAVASDIPTPPPTPTAAASPRGRLVFTRSPRGSQDGASEIYTHDLATGASRRLTSNGDNDWIPCWSPDGRRIAFTSNRGNTDKSNYDIWVMNADGSDPQRLAGTGAWDEYAAWSPLANGQIAFSTTGMTNGVANSEIFIGSDAQGLRRLTTNTGRDEWPSWSPDGSQIVHSSEQSGSRDIFLTVVATGNSRRLYGTPADENHPALSPDGRLIVFVSRPQPQEAFGQLFLMDSSGGSASAITGAIASDPAWSPDSRWIVFARGVDSNGNSVLDLQDESDLWAIEVATGALVPLVREPGNDSSPSWAF